MTTQSSVLPKMTAKRWLVAPAIPQSTCASLTAAGYPLLTAQLLYNRGVETTEEAQRFLDGELVDSDDPLQLTGLPAAVDRIHHALAKQERIVVYGDYDTDGVTATVLLVQVLRALGGDVHPYIPDREEEGYGLNIDAVRSIRSEHRAALLISVDCGVRALGEAEAARELGLDLIVTDHHEPGAELPRALAIVNPKQLGDTYPYRDLAGVGLAFKLAQGVVRAAKSRPLITASDVLDLVALGTVADMAPLTGENRKLVRQGLNAINRARRKGLEQLMLVARLKPGGVDATAIGFALGPRLNAAGRLESALAAYELLETSDGARAWELAQLLEEQNRRRQELTRETHARAREIALAARGDAALLFAADPGFREGVVGLAAARLMEEFYRPAVVACQGPQSTKGSGRSIREFHITEALDQCQDLLDKHGGHAAAAGFTTQTKNVPELAARLQALAERQLGQLDLQPTLLVDVDEVPLAELDPDMYAWLCRFEPCGFKNPTPILASRGVKILASRTVGADSRHLKLTVTDGRVWFDAIAFGQGALLNQLTPYVDLAYQVEMNEWNGDRRLQLNVRSLQPSS